jgi:type II secretory pathway component PulL
MKTTLNLDDDVLELLKAYAEQQSVGLSKAASELLRRSLTVPVQTRLVNGFHAVLLQPNSPKVTSETIQHLLEDEI